MGNWLENSLLVVRIDFLKVFKLVVDTGNPYLDAALTIIVIAMLIGGVILIYRAKNSGRSPKKAKP